jgi:solute carrier family 25 protein 33/36
MQELLLRHTYKTEGPLSLFKGLGPTLVGVIPARSINFFTYGNGKLLYSKWLTSDGRESASIHLLAAATAGIVTATATNPIWVVKTRIQLDPSVKQTVLPKMPLPQALQNRFNRSYNSGAPAPLPGSNVRGPSAVLGSLACIRQIWAQEGLRGFYRGLSASYLGVTEGVIQWTLYEQFKRWPAKGSGKNSETAGFGGKGAAAGLAKLVATVITYPHEVVRTRLRQQPPPGQIPRYTGLWQTFKLVFAEEGFQALYGGLSPHLLRVVPNAVALYVTYEAFLRWFGIQS